MKIFSFATLALASVCCVSYAQQAPQKDDSKLQVIIQFKNDKDATVRSLDSADGDTFRYTTQQNGQMAAKFSDCKVFVIQSPKELLAGKRQYAAQKYKAARKNLAECKTKYAPYASLPVNPAREAALLEIQCAVAMLDFPALGGMYNSFPSKGMLPEMKNEKAIYDAAGVLAGVKDNMSPAEAKKLQEKATAFLDTLVAKKVGDGKYSTVEVSGSVYGWGKYALGRALAAQLPADQIASRSISAENRALASAAVDAFCEAAVSSHGADMEIAKDSLARAQEILWAMPGVKEYCGKIKKPENMNASEWKKCPADFRDAVSIAYLLQNVYQYKPKDGSPIKEAVKYYFNDQKGKK